MEQLGEHKFFYSKNTDKHYEVVDVGDRAYCILDFVIRECKLELFTVTQVAIDPDNSKEYKYVEVYIKTPIGRKRRISLSLANKLFSRKNGSFLLDMYDKFLYK